MVTETVQGKCDDKSCKKTGEQPRGNRHLIAGENMRKVVIQLLKLKLLTLTRLMSNKMRTLCLWLKLVLLGIIVLIRSQLTWQYVWVGCQEVVRIFHHSVTELVLSVVKFMK